MSATVTLVSPRTGTSQTETVMRRTRTLAIQSIKKLTTLHVSMSLFAKQHS
jgi:hypothetical protein